MARTKKPKIAIAKEPNGTEKKRKGKPPALPLGASDELYTQYCARALRAKNDADTARLAYKSKDGAYRAVLKEAKKLGVDPDALTWWLAEKDKDPEVLRREVENRMRVSRLMSMPIGTQWSLLPSAAPADAPASKDRGVMQAEAYGKGYTAGKAAETLDADRYPNDPDLQERFETGWQDGQNENTRALAGGAGNGEAHATH